MLNNGTRRIVTLLTSVAFLLTTLVGSVNAAMVGTATALSDDQRAERITDVQNWLMKEEVRDQLAAMGVNPEDAGKRVASMTNEELRMLHGRIGNVPAGAGVVEVIGIVFIILLILELVGITNVFSQF